MEAFRIAYKLVNSIAKRASDAKSNVSDCQHLADLAAKTEDILGRIEADASDNPSLLRALGGLTDALQSVDDAIKDCCETTFFGALIRSQKHQAQLKEAAVEIGDALRLISLATINQTAADKSDIESLIGELRNAQFKESVDATTRMADLQRQLDINFNKSRDEAEHHSQRTQQGQDVIVMMVQDLQIKLGEIDTSEEDLKVLKADLAQARENKEAREQYQLEQLIAALELAEDKGPEPKKEEASNEPPSVLICPISKDVMWDPVLVIESEMTYDRESIEGWFALGNSTDPLTGKRLISKQVVRNMAVRSAARGYYTRRGLPFYLSESIASLELKFDPDTFGGYNDNPRDKNRHVSTTRLSVTGRDWNRGNYVKTNRLLLQREWIGAEAVNGKQIGIGLSITRYNDGGIRFNDNSVGIYYDDEVIHWGQDEPKTDSGFNSSFHYRLRRDPEGGNEILWISVDYRKNKLWYMHPFMLPIDFDLPVHFKNKPLYGHYQVWNDKMLRLATRKDGERVG